MQATGHHSLRMQLRLIAKKTIWWPTWLGWVCIALLAILLPIAILLQAYPFLAVTCPVEANILVVEGWLPSYALRFAEEEFRRRPYDYVVAGGGTVSAGSIAWEQKTYAAIASKTLLQLGIPPEKVIEAPAPASYRYRTLMSTKGVHDALESRGITVKGLNVISLGAHSRRSLTVYRRVFGRRIKVGMISCATHDYDAARWWASSEGTKELITEGIGWLHESIVGAGDKATRGTERP